MSDPKPSEKQRTLNICINFRAGNLIPSCGAVGSKELADALEAGIAERGLPLTLRRLHCMGKCHIGPTVKLSHGGPFVMGAKDTDVPQILDWLEAEDWDALKEAFPLPKVDINLEE
ncbi:MAG: (2Fe-2S) ferredoxin domain-containing protein [Rhodospirillaceae bacterium]|nr:(2Fe-2S) ferredoxin domain-containing protein [Rhodospirillaceae bacterium]MDD9918387.1 (2Fe-2S) ferredoxin domain-containing protein [Rhodospirillaceae bacterium]MDD9925966.1 (2Fe-2S) ferredoxin domain-containing protein [Rhodospirillaceae bacterium]